MWKKLESLPRHEHNYAFLKQHFDKDTDFFIKNCFERTTEVAEVYPCDNQGGRGCPRKVFCLNDETFVAVCGDRPQRCEELFITREDIKVYKLSVHKIAYRIAAILSDERFIKDIESVDSIHNLVRIGYYNPRGSLRIPILIHVPMYDGDKEAAIFYLTELEEGYILFVPTISNLRPKLKGSFRNKHCMIFGLDPITSEARFIDVRGIYELFDAFIEKLAGKEEKKSELFPTLSGATWSDITITFIDGHVIRVTCNKKGKKISAIYNFTQIGMADARRGEPNKQWMLLQGFAEERGVFTWYNAKAGRNQKKQKQELKNNLQKFFGIDDDPFEAFKNEKGHICYRAKFNLYSDE